ncbi:MAG: alpha/beta hydrolase [Microbacterium sp.]
MQQLRNVQQVLDRDPESHLESFFLLEDRPYATIGFGDVDTADLVVFVMHGIETTLTELPGWADAAQRIAASTIRSCVARGEPRRVATVAWFAWDSGTHVSALATRHATIGAARLAVDLDRIAARNPAARVAIVGYSYSATLLGELVAMNLAGDVHTAFSIAAAGVTHAARTALETSIALGELELHATEAAPDGVAPLGRIAQHPVDPRDIPGVIVYESDGGDVPGLDGAVVRGLAVDGHASMTSSDEHGKEHIGYFDQRAQPFLYLIARLADAATAP